MMSRSGNGLTIKRFFRRPSMAIRIDRRMAAPDQNPHPSAIGAFPKARRLAREMGIPL